MTAIADRRTGTGRVPPHDLQAEQSLLGAVLLSRDAIGAAIDAGLRSDDFYSPAHGHLFAAVQALYSAGEPIDAVTVADELRRANLLEAVGGPASLVDLQLATPAVSSAGHYARIITEHALLRRLISVAGEIAEIGYGLPDDVDKAIDRAESMVFEINQRRVVDSEARVNELLRDALDHLEQLALGDIAAGIPTGFTDVDRLLGGLAPSTLTIVGARPSMGKTALSLGIATHVATRVGLPVLFCSLEMGHRELTQRMLATEARVDSARLRTGELAESDWQRLVNALGVLEPAELYIDDNPNLTVTQIRAKARRLKSRAGRLGLVVVDYLQLMSGRAGAENRQLEVAEISRGLKVLARELEVPVVALSQLNRSLEQRADKRPMLADLRESGGIEADADVILFIYRDEVYHPDSPDSGLAEIIVAKHRNGPTGIRKLAFLPAYTRFANMASM